MFYKILQILQSKEVSKNNINYKTIVNFKRLLKINGNIVFAYML